MKRARLAVGLVGVLSFSAPQVVAADAPQVSACRKQCYEAKTKAYQECRALPATDREARARCFQRADDQLKACLGRC